MNPGVIRRPVTAFGARAANRSLIAGPDQLER
jgi:hypothetical protein